jgi:hypothetical protein
LGARASDGGDDRGGTEKICREDPGEGFIFVWSVVPVGRR